MTPITRTQGCWSCIHWENEEKSRQLWSQQRQRTLTDALTFSMSVPEGEEHPQVFQIRKMVNTVDHGVASGHLGICLIGKSGTDFVDNAYLCDSWSGREGASVARASQKADKLPGELREEMEDSLKNKGEQN